VVSTENGGPETNVGSITGNGALTIAAGGTNQNLTLAASGTGKVIINDSNLTGSGALTIAAGVPIKT